MNTAFFPLLAAALLAAPLEGGKESAELRGAWKLVSVEAESGPAGLPDARQVFVIKGDRLLYGGREIATLRTETNTSPAAGRGVVVWHFMGRRQTPRVSSGGYRTSRHCGSGEVCPWRCRNS